GPVEHPQPGAGARLLLQGLRGPASRPDLRPLLGAPARAGGSARNLDPQVAPARRRQHCLKGSRPMTHIHELAGRPACGGKAAGRPVIVHSVSDLDKVEPGDILVAVETEAIYAPAM